MSKNKPETLTDDKAADETYISFNQTDDRNPQTLNSTYKSSLFEQIFNSKSEALSLYNAIASEHVQSQHARTRPALFFTVIQELY